MLCIFFQYVFDYLMVLSPAVQWGVGNNKTYKKHWVLSVTVCDFTDVRFRYLLLEWNDPVIFSTPQAWEKTERKIEELTARSTCWQVWLTGVQSQWDTDW